MESNENINNSSPYPESFNCPLTYDIMVDPVIDPEGNSYERSAILAWLDINKVSPITRNPLKKDQLITNRSLRNSIGEYKSGNKINNVPNSSKEVQETNTDDTIFKIKNEVLEEQIKTFKATNHKMKNKIENMERQIQNIKKEKVHRGRNFISNHIHLRFNGEQLTMSSNLSKYF
jgi:hypothetical protein